MNLVAVFIMAIILLVIGIILMNPRFFWNLMTPKYLCCQCHTDLTKKEKFRLGFVNEEREERKV